MLNVNPIPRALHRHMMVMGCERAPVLSMALLCGGGVMAGVMKANLLTIAISLIAFGAVVLGLRAMAKDDPMMFQVYLRALKYPSFIPARSTPWQKGK